MELSGKVIAVLEPRGGVSKTGNPWKVQEYVIETHDQYPRRMCFDVFGEDKITQFNIQVGEELTYTSMWMHANGKVVGSTLSVLGRWNVYLLNNQHR